MLVWRSLTDEQCCVDSCSFVVQGGEREDLIRRAPAQGRATADNPTKATNWANTFWVVKGPPQPYKGPYVYRRPEFKPLVAPDYLPKRRNRLADQLLRFQTPKGPAGPGGEKQGPQVHEYGKASTKKKPTQIA